MMMKMMKKHSNTSIHHSQSPRSDCQGSIFGSVAVAAFSSNSSPTLSSMRTISMAVSPTYSSATKMLLIFGLLWSSLLTNQLALSINIDQNQSKNLILVDSSQSANDDGPRQQQQQQQKDVQNGPLSSSSAAAAASSSSPTSTASASSAPISSSSTSTSTLLAIKSLESLLDQMNGEQFVQLFDQLMDGELSRIIGHIQTKTNQKLETIPANKFSAKQYINILDDYSSGLVSARLEQIVAKLAQLKQQQQQAGSSRPRRSSFDSLTGLSMGYSKRSFDAMGGASLGSPSKRSINFDEMDRSGFSGFAKRRSFGGGAAFDEIDNSGFAGFNKRRSVNDFDEMDHSGFAGFAKRYADFDEIDRSGFNSFAKRSADFDEMDHSGFVGFAKRHRPASLLASKRVNFDELDHSGFSGFSGYGKRYFISPIIDMINRAKLQAWAKQNKLQRSSNIHSERLK